MTIEALKLTWVFIRIIFVFRNTLEYWVVEVMGGYGVTRELRTEFFYAKR